MGESLDQFPSALAVAAAIRTREVSPTEVLDATIERIDRINPALNAVIWRNDDDAHVNAKNLTEKIAKGKTDLPPFAGVPIPIKDLTPVAGWPVTYGSFGAPEGPSVEGELVTEALRKAGFILCGRTNTPEFGPLTVTENVRYGVTRNPWNTDLTPGGSSGGAGASVASGMFAVAHANDGGGSIRIPASCCGLVGLKPSRGRVPSRVPGWQGMAIEGAVTRTVADTAAILDCISAPDPYAWYNAPVPKQSFASYVDKEPKSLRVALMGTSGLGLTVEPGPLEAMNHAGQLLEKLGHKVTTLDTDLFDPEALGPFLNVVNTGLGDYEHIEWAKTEAHNQAALEAAKQIDSVTLVQSLTELQRISRKVVARWGSEFDVLVTPTMTIEPPVAGTVLAEMQDNPTAPSMTVVAMAAFTAVYNITGLPAINVPLHWSDAGIPIGVQIVGGPWQDALLIQVASQLEKMEPWAGRRPSSD
ncbi:MAG: amidase [Acidimicrobiales bacterium]